MSQKYSVRLLSGTTEEWDNTTYIIPKDELVIERTTDDDVLFKLGDGIHIFGDLPYINLGSGSSGDSVQIDIEDVDGLSDALEGKEPLISPGTATQYLRGDKTWQTLDKNAVGLGNVPNVSTNDQTPTYDVPDERTALQSGDTLSAALGKIKKWLSSLGSLAFKSSVSKTDLDASVFAEYRTSAAQDLIDTGKQAKLTPGTNITIDENNVISASGGGGSETSVLSQTGDIIIRNSTGAVRLGIGTAGQVLTVVSGLPAWQTLPTYDGDVEYLTAYDGGVIDE